MTDSSKPLSMIVGVGASAGGLSAFESFLRGNTDNGDFGYVLVQHLDPTHESELPGILQRVTSAGVHAAKDGLRVEAGQVYVIPSGKILTIRDGVLHLADPDDGANVRTPIDTFLRSLAEDQGSKAACVILSGTGTDGTLGLKSIKEHGGICLVQDPEEAEYAGMPRAAIATGLVDIIAPVNALGERLTSYRRVEPRVPEGTDASEDGVAADEQEEERILRKTFELLRQRTGLDFSTYKTATIWRRIRHRMQLLQVQTVVAYFERLQDSPNECWTLTREFLISVTNFFRDPEAFEALATRCVPQLFANKTEDDTIRVWVPGCATGEEAYSLLMLLLEHRSTSTHSPSIQIFATDIDEKALKHARVGFYPPSIRADVSESRLQQFFTHEEGGYRVRPELREAILFAEHDLLSDPPFSSIDLVSCRNVLIYLKPETQRKVLTLFHYALNEQKYLFLGRSETPEARKELYAAMKKAPHLYRTRQGKADYPYPLVPGSQPDRVTATPRWQSRDRSSMKGFHRRLLTNRFMPPSVLVDDSFQILHMAGRVGDFLEVQPGPPSNRLDDVVPRVMRAELRAALYSAFNREQKGTLRFELDADEKNAASRWLKVNVEPVEKTVRTKGETPMIEPYALVTFEEQVPSDRRPEQTPTLSPDASEHQLREELQRTRHRLEVVTEEYETSNEELLASNEELQSANEELRSTMEALQANREELQSTNEELVTVNQELKAKIEALNQRNSDVQNLMEATDIGTLYLNTDLELRRYTARATDLFNVIPSDVGRPFQHLSHVFDGEALASEATEVLEELEPVMRELQSESGRWYKMRMLPYRTLEDKVEGVLMNFFDITDLKRAEAQVEQVNAELEQRVEARTRELKQANQALQAKIEERERARNHFQKLFRLGPVAGLMTSLEEGRILDVNERYLHLTGYSREELLDNTLTGLGLLEEDQHERLFAVLRDEGQLRNEELELTTRDGEILLMMFSYEVIDQDDGLSVLSLGVNITARKQAEEALRKAKQESEEMNRLKTSFIANMSHEIRTPLTGIIGFADILEDRVEGDETKQHVHYIRTNGRRLLETLDSVLDLARLDADQIHLDPSPVALRPFAEETLALFEQRATNKNLTLELEVDEELVPVQIDESALQRILTNLVGNALKFTEEGTVRLAVGLDESSGATNGARRLRIEVTDTGIGMEPAFLEQLFEEFTQEQAGMTRSHEGAGLGLAITRRLVRLMDGTIEVDSEPGRGTTFVVRVPYEPVGETGQMEDVEVVRWSGADWGEKTCRVLVVDDRPEVGVIVEQFLSDCEVVAATSADEGLGIVKDETVFDLVLVDIQLGEGRSGMEVLPDLREQMEADGMVVPIVAVTAHSLPGDRQRFLDEGFDGYLSKPFTRTDLRRTVERAMRSVHPD